MQQDLLPLFPLQVVLFPRAPLPLHVFEPRYKEMMGDVIPGHAEFGIVLAAEKGIVNTGCTAVVEKVVKRYPDGRLDLVAVGRRRFEVFLLNEEKPYLRGAVEFFDDDDRQSAPQETRDRAVEGYWEARRLESPEETPDPEMQDPQLSFQLAQVVPDLEVRQVLLNTRSEADRIRHLAEYFPKFISRQKHITHLRAVAPTNGHGTFRNDD
ncbi:MAG: LON peptidase substrate-binding domain-containing protein [Bryobacteraceae bacterium]